MKSIVRCLRIACITVLIVCSPSIPQTLAAQAPATQAPATQGPTKTNDALELVKQGQKLNSEGKQDEAMALYERALQLSPNLFQAELAAGVALDLDGLYSKARQYLAKAIVAATP